MDKLELVKKIEHAFPLAPLPQALARETTPYYDEYSYVEVFFSEKLWNAFSMKELWEAYEGDPSAIPSFMSDKALTYYLPGFLMLTITDYGEADLLVDSVVNMLTPSGNYRLNSLKPDFNRLQANAIAGFLTYVSEEYPGEFEQSELDKAIQFWSQIR